MSVAHIRLTALYALELRYLTNRLTSNDRAEWLRLVGTIAQPATGNVVPLIQRNDVAWGLAVTQLIGMKVVIQNTTA